MSTETETAAPEHLPRSWAFEAREPYLTQLPPGKCDRPWNWLALDRNQARVVWETLARFVEFLNHRYLERPDRRIPRCWAEHGVLVEELTTLAFARYHAFEGNEGTIGSAQFWHSYSLPMFLSRMADHLGADRLRKCQAGKHEELREDGTDEPELEDEQWNVRTGSVAMLDLEVRPKPAPRAAPQPDGRAADRLHREREAAAERSRGHKSEAALPPGLIGLFGSDEDEPE